MPEGSAQVLRVNGERELACPFVNNRDRLLVSHDPGFFRFEISHDNELIEWKSSIQSR